MNLSPRVTFFNQGQFELMKTRVFELLDQRGVRMDHPGSRHSMRSGPDSANK